MNVVTRFAPSPTGFLHIGGARTALFNWLFAKGSGGQYLLRIEDTDRKRSTQEAINEIINGLEWLNLSPDERPIFQSENAERHSQVANNLLAAGKAYRCYCSPEELIAMRKKAQAEGKTRLYDGTWRDRDPADAPRDIQPVIRFRAPTEGETVNQDLVQGSVTVSNLQLDDMILLRADGSPTYMLSVVVDDHDMGVTHAIRGDDHLTNSFRQTQLFHAIGWAPPQYAHIPLIHGPDGAKLSKRHGALGIDSYREMGFLPEALLSYLLRLGWSHGDEDIIPIDKAVDWFDITHVGRGAARIDFDKLASINSHYIRESGDETLFDLIKGPIEERIQSSLDQESITRLKNGIPALKSRAKTIPELIDNIVFYVQKRPLILNKKATNILNSDARKRLAQLAKILGDLGIWSENSIEKVIKDFANQQEINLKQIALPFRVAITGTTISPGIFEVAKILGQQETMGRLKDVAEI
jgi:glutamyl-tRNA synthetase